MTTTAAHDLVVAARTTEPDTDLVAVRAWARSVGYPVDESAYVPADVLQTYRRVQAPLH